MWDKVGQLTGRSRSRTHGLITVVIERTSCTCLLMLNTIFFIANLLLMREDQPPLRWKYFKHYTNQNPLHPVWIVSQHAVLYRLLQAAAPIADLTCCLIYLASQCKAVVKSPVCTKYVQLPN